MLWPDAVAQCLVWTTHKAYKFYSPEGNHHSDFATFPQKWILLKSGEVILSAESAWQPLDNLFTVRTLMGEYRAPHIPNCWGRARCPERPPHEPRPGSRPIGPRSSALLALHIERTSGDQEPWPSSMLTVTFFNVLLSARVIVDCAMSDNHSFN